MFSIDDSLEEEDFIKAALSAESDWDGNVEPKRPKIQEAGSNIFENNDSESQSPVISLVAPVGKLTKSSPGQETKIATSSISPNTAKRKFVFRTSPSEKSKSVSFSPEIFNKERNGQDNTTLWGNSSNKHLSRQKIRRSPAKTTNYLFNISQDSSLDSDLDLSLDSDIFPGGTAHRKPSVRPNNVCNQNVEDKRKHASSPAPTCINPKFTTGHLAPPASREQIGASLITSSSKPTFKTPSGAPSLSRLGRSPVTPGAILPPTQSPNVSKEPFMKGNDASAKKGEVGAGNKRKRSPDIDYKNGTGHQVGTASKEECSPLVPAMTNNRPSVKNEDTKSVFESSPWKQMKDDLEPQSELILRKHSLSLLKRQAGKKELRRGKVPVICAVIESIDIKNDDATALLRDPTGTMRGSLHRELMKEHQSEIVEGTVLVLRQVSVLSPTPRSHFLNITANNVVRMYTQKDSNTRILNKGRFDPADFVLHPVEPPAPRAAAHTAPPQVRPAIFNTTGAHSPITSPRMVSPHTGHMQTNQGSRFQFRSRGPTNFTSTPTRQYVPNNRSAYPSTQASSGYHSNQVRTPTFVSRHDSSTAPHQPAGFRGIRHGTASNVTPRAGPRHAGMTPPSHAVVNNWNFSSPRPNNPSTRGIGLHQRDMNITGVSKSSQVNASKSKFTFKSPTGPASRPSQPNLHNSSSTPVHQDKNYVTFSNSSKQSASSKTSTDNTDLWQDDDGVELEDFLTGIGDELFDAF